MLDSGGARKRVQIALLTAPDATNPKSWSGTPFHMTQALGRHLGELRQIGPMPFWPRNLMKVGARINASLSGTRSLTGHGGYLAHFYGQVADRRLARLAPPPDLIFSPAGSALLAKLKTDLPVVYSSDATVRVMLDYYPQFAGLSDRAIRNAETLEREAITRADLLLYPTHWAANSAIMDYGADPGRVHVLPYGANLMEVPEAPQTKEDTDGVCRLLMVGVDWGIKGGAIAVETLQALHASGVAAELIIVGCAPPKPVELPGLTFIPFLDKNRPEDRLRLSALYRQASFFILPTRCECYGIVFCEAAAYALPAITSRTGGVPEVVREGETGVTIALAGDGSVYAERIAALWSDRPRYQAMRAASRQAFETRLNWDVWGRSASRAIHAMLEAR